MHKSIGKQKSLRENIWQTNYSSIAKFDFVNIYHYHENAKQVKSEMTQNKRNKTGQMRPI